MLSSKSSIKRLTVAVSTLLLVVGASIKLTTSSSSSSGGATSNPLNRDILLRSLNENANAQPRNKSQQVASAPTNATAPSTAQVNFTSTRGAPQPPVSKEISCEELNLIVRTQKVLKVTRAIASRFIECKPQIELLSSFNESQPVAHEQQAKPEFNVGLTDASASGRQVAAPHEVRSLHFGAKVALFILSATILLVLAATWFDLHLEEKEAKMRQFKSGRKHCYEFNIVDSVGCDNERGADLNSLLTSIQFSFNQQQQLVAGQRDERSPSVSSSSSSLLFSANSAASAPILGSQHRGAASRVNWKREETSRERERESAEGWYKFAPKQQHQLNVENHNHYKQNIQMLGLETVNYGLNRARKHEEKLFSEENLNQKLQAPAAEINQSTIEPPVVDKAHVFDKGWLLKEVFLAFSIRHSASLIFNDDVGERKRKQAIRSLLLKRQLNGHRSRVSSLSSIDEDSTKQAECEKAKAGKLDESDGRSESIDSLHGLRFLSMIWIIVIHSYNFALRWSFFSSTSSLDDLYKTAASQLLANGTFACDSFFFIGGFLLPYLAFPPQPAQPAQPSTSTLVAPTTRKQESDISPGSLSQSGCSSPDDCRQQQRQDSSSSSSDDSRQAALSYVISTSSSQQNTAALRLPASRNHTNNAWHKTCAQQSNSQQTHLHTNEFTLNRVLINLLHRYIRMMPLMMAIIGLSASLLRYLGEGPVWDDSTMMFDKWCRDNWWINGLFLHNFLNTSNMCLSHSWYSAVDIQLFFIGQLILFILFRSRKFGIFIISLFLLGTQLITGILTLIHHLPAVPLISSVSEQSTNLYYGEIYIKPYCRASPYLIGILLAYLMRTTSLGQVRLSKWKALIGWLLAIGVIFAILMAMQPAMNGQPPSELQSALYSALSRPLWACATGWMIFACMTENGGIFRYILAAKPFVPLSKLTYPAFLIHPIVMAIIYGSRQSSFQFSHYLMLYLILGNIVITYASAFLLSVLFELPLLSIERAVKRAWSSKETKRPKRATKSAAAAAT